MKIAAIFGSPRKGNSRFLAECLLKPLEDSGAEVTRWFLPTMQYSGCIACNACKTKKESCVLQDDLTPLLESLKQTDVVVISSPVYFMDTSSTINAMVERWYSYLLPMYYTGKNRSTRLPEGKQAVLIVSQGAPEDQFQDIAIRMGGIFQVFNFLPAHLVRSGFGIDPEAASKNEALIAKIQDVAQCILDKKEPESPIPKYSQGF